MGQAHMLTATTRALQGSELGTQPCHWDAVHSFRRYRDRREKKVAVTAEINRTDEYADMDICSFVFPSPTLDEYSAFLGYLGLSRDRTNVFTLYVGLIEVCLRLQLWRKNHNSESTPGKISPRLIQLYMQLQVSLARPRLSIYTIPRFFFFFLQNMTFSLTCRVHTSPLGKTGAKRTNQSK